MDISKNTSVSINEGEDAADKVQNAEKNENKATNAAKIVIESNEEFPTDWEIDSYRREFESDAHWNLRRRFMVMHKNNFPEDRLVCLAQVFTNIEFMECRYPDETMQLIAELSKDVAKEFREERATRLKRTFVTASDAAEQRAKGHRATQQPQQQPVANNDNNSSTSMEAQAELRRGLDKIDLFDGLKYGKFVLTLHNGRNCLRLSAMRSNMEYLEQENTTNNRKKQVDILIDGKIVVQGCADTIKNAKLDAHNKALAELQRMCYSIKLNAERDTIQIEKKNNEVKMCVTQQTADGNDDKKLDENNVGYKLMKRMGWTGGGLGANKEGREEPVSYLLKNNRSGLGSECKIDKFYFKAMLKNYIHSDDLRELQFEPTFTKDERALLHTIAGSLGLRSSSYGVGEMRRLIVSKKICDELILTEVLNNRNPKYCNRYFIQVPESKSQKFPANIAKLELTT